MRFPIPAAHAVRMVVALACALALALTAVGAASATPATPSTRAASATPATPAASATSAATAATASSTGSLTGHVTATSGAGAVPAAGVSVTATGPAGTSYAATSAGDGFYELDNLPVGTYTIALTPAGGSSQPGTDVVVSAAANTTADQSLTAPVATITGRVTDRRHRPLSGVPVGVSTPSVVECPTAAICGPSTTSAADGRYTLNVVAGGYTLAVQDAGHVVAVRAITLTAGTQMTENIHLAPAAIPAGTSQAHAGRDLRWLNAERARSGLPAGIVLNGRWASECAAHDAYERANDVLSHAENPQAPDASAGGAWAGLTSVLAQGRWGHARTPWENAPIHLLQLFTPSLAVVGLDDSHGFQCATTYPGLVRTPVESDTVSTYPADGAQGVAPSEVAREAPFTPGQFVGIPAGRRAGRELFVYLNLSGQTGQAQVEIVRAALSRGGHSVALRWVDNSTRTVGRYLTGAILIPVRPLQPHATYRASVVVRDRSGTLSHSWSFTTGGQ